MKIYKCKSLHGPLLIVVLSIDAGRKSVRILSTLMCSLTVQILEIVPWMITGRLKYVPFPPHSLILRVLQIWISYLLHLPTSFFSPIHSMDVFCAFCIKEARAEKLNDKNPFSPEFIFELNEARTHKNPNSLQSVHRFNQKISWLAEFNMRVGTPLQIRRRHLFTLKPSRRQSSSLYRSARLSVCALHVSEYMKRIQSVGNSKSQTIYIFNPLINWISHPDRRIH